MSPEVTGLGMASHLAAPLPGDAPAAQDGAGRRLRECGSPPKPPSPPQLHPAAAGAGACLFLGLAVTGRV